jgi:Zinc finger, C2H2 type
MPVPVLSNEVANRVKMGTATDRHREELTMPSGPIYQYNHSSTNSPSLRSQPSGPYHFHPLSGVMPRSPAYQAQVGTRSPDFSVSLNSQCNPFASPLTDCQHPGASRARPQQSREYNNEINPASFSGDPAPPNRLACTRKAASRQYSCHDCGKRYTQPQGLRRHRNETHESELCIYCLAFQWGRRYKLKKHIRDKHPELNIDTALDLAMVTRRGAAITSRYSSPLLISLRAAERYRWCSDDLSLSPTSDLLLVCYQ